ncbi:MAG: hypothetical protein PF961_03845 [Planctomycetota bacterium]|nr:hypothetical protein [Planctomycetota bacterium]
MNRYCLLAPLLVLLAVSLGAAELRLPISADNSIVDYKGERHLNAGAKQRIRIKGNQHLVAMDFDPAPLRGAHIKRAWLYARQADHAVAGVTVASIACPWDELTSSYFTAGRGIDGWGVAGLRFPVMGGGHWYAWRCQARSEIVDGWYRWEIDPDLVYARALALSHGISIHEWDADYSRNPTIHSRESRASEPYLLVETGGTPSPPPQAPTKLRWQAEGVDDLRLYCTPPDVGFAYQLSVNGSPVPAWNCPPVRPGAGEQLILVRDLALAPGPATLSLRCLNRLGEASAAVELAVTIPSPAQLPAPPALGSRVHVEPPLVAVIPALDLYDSAGAAVGVLPPGYREVNPITAGDGVYLSGARGEILALQVLVPRHAEPLAIAADLPGLTPQWYRLAPVRSGERRIGDPMIALSGPMVCDDASNAAVMTVAIPYDEQRTEIVGTVQVGGETLRLAISVHPFALPRKPVIRCEMNGYGLPDSVAQYQALQCLAQAHRVHVNLVHYSHRSGAPDMRQTTMDMRLPTGRRMNEDRYNAIRPGAITAYWDDFVAAFDPVLTGQAFAESQRGAIPIPGFYLSFHESWPLKVRQFFNGNPDAYAAFDDQRYADTFVAVLEDFDRLAGEHGWDAAGFQIYCNNKGKLDDPNKAPWILDEPVTYWDFRALAFYQDLVARAQRRHTPELRYRIDISRPEYTRGQLPGRDALWVVNSGSLRDHPRLLHDRRVIHGTSMWTYGTSNAVGTSNRETAAWVLWSGLSGATGVVPWQTINRDGRALREADQLGLFIFDGATIRPSLRLLAYMRAEQDLAYLRLLQQKRGWSETDLLAYVAQFIDLSATRETRNANDAGTDRFAVDPWAIHALRRQCAELISAAQ